MFGSKKKTPNFKFDLGVELKDTITGFKGVVTYRTQWIHNCNVYGLQPQGLNSKGKPFERCQFDEPQLEQIAEEVIKPKRDTGGPNDNMQSNNRL